VKALGGYQLDHPPDVERRTSVRDIPLSHVPLLGARIGAAFSAHNVWGLEYTRLYPVLRVQRYVRGDYIGRHIDYDYQIGEHVKLTGVVPLVEASQWEGGCLHVGNDLGLADVEMGDCVIFPGFAIHEVTRVSRGQRISLAAWAMGSPVR
jgi:predicted 2-oxoglutarate/Fe(II)-dependent dioxygenase YbiX